MTQDACILIKYDKLTEFFRFRTYLILLKVLDFYLIISDYDSSYRALGILANIYLSLLLSFNYLKRTL